jgi:hypothetical protein
VSVHTGPETKHPGLLHHYGAGVCSHLCSLLSLTQRHVGFFLGGGAQWINHSIILPHFKGGRGFFLFWLHVKAFFKEDGASLVPSLRNIVIFIFLVIFKL